MIRKTPPFYILTGPPGSGKTRLLGHLTGAFNTVPECARRVLAEQRATGGTATGEQDAQGFVDRMLALALSDYQAARGVTLFDRGIPDLLAFCAHYQLPKAKIQAAIQARRYRKSVFYLPPWREIYHTDAERRLDFHGAVAFGEYIRAAYLEADYDLIEVVPGSLDDRAAFISACMAH